MAHVYVLPIERWNNTKLYMKMICGGASGWQRRTK